MIQLIIIYQNNLKIEKLIENIFVLHGTLQILKKGFNKKKYN